MAAKFVPVDRNTHYLFPPCVQDYLPEDHLVRFVVDMVEQLDVRHLAAQQEREEKTGKKPVGRPPQPTESGARDHDQVNLTDEASLIMPTVGGRFEQSCRA